MLTRNMHVIDIINTKLIFEELYAEKLRIRGKGKPTGNDGYTYGICLLLRGIEELKDIGIKEQQIKQVIDEVLEYVDNNSE